MLLPPYTFFFGCVTFLFLPRTTTALVDLHDIIPVPSLFLLTSRTLLGVWTPSLGALCSRRFLPCPSFIRHKDCGHLLHLVASRRGMLAIASTLCRIGRGLSYALIRCLHTISPLHRLHTSNTRLLTVLAANRLLTVLTANRRVRLWCVIFLNKKNWREASTNNTGGRERLRERWGRWTDGGRAYSTCAIDRDTTHTIKHRKAQQRNNNSQISKQY